MIGLTGEGCQEGAKMLGQLATPCQSEPLFWRRCSSLLLRLCLGGGATARGAILRGLLFDVVQDLQVFLISSLHQDHSYNGRVNEGW